MPFISVEASPETAAASENLIAKNRSNQAITTVDGSDTLEWTEDAKLIAFDGAEYDLFGRSVDVSGDTAVVGAMRADPNGNSDQGAAYVYTRSGTNWSLQAKLLANDGDEDDNFGKSVAINGDTIIIGAFGVNSNQGAAYVFTRSGPSWSQQAKLTASDGSPDDYFGFFVGTSGETVIVGAPFSSPGGNNAQGSAYTFTRSGTTWSQQAKLIATDGRAGDYFGISTAISDDTVVVGAYFSDLDGNSGQGAAYVFTRSGMAWSQQAKLVANDGDEDDNFGKSVAVSNDTALVGAFGNHSAKGAAYVFTRTGMAWSQQTKLIANDGSSIDFFGVSVDLDKDVAIVGAHYADLNQRNNEGAAYIFTRSGTAWSQQTKLIASDGSAGDHFGVEVAVEGGVAVVGAHFANYEGVWDQGVAYIFTTANHPIFIPIIIKDEN